MSFTSTTPFQLSGRYADLNKWEILNGPGDSRPTGRQIVEDEDLVDAWKSKVILITGVSSGIGVETARVLALTGATVFGTARNLEKARDALGAKLLESGRVKLLLMDQSDLASVRACAAEFRRQSGTLNIIVNNAAVMNTPKSQTKDGFELQFGTNHLSHFLLFHLLKDLLLASSTPEFHSRVVSVASAGHLYSPLRLDDLNFAADGAYNGWAAYGSSKTANIYMTNQIERLYGSQGLHGNSVHPGSFISPNLQKHSSAEMDAVAKDEKFARYMSSTEQACATTVYGAVSAELEGKGGRYLEGASTTVMPVPKDTDGLFEYGYAEWAFDQEKEEKLWEISKEMVGVQ
ncbi:short-chain dehydrogenase [Xylariaceae sp. FL0255]|nr:short-chain dehydrogenase [Xylariaceae sp. FL0255]